MLLVEAAYIAFKVYVLLIHAFPRNRTHVIGDAGAFL